MLKSRRGLLAAGLAVAVVGAIGVASTLNAGAEQISGAPTSAADTTADSKAADTDQVPVADTPTGAVADVTPPALLPWGERPSKIHRGKAGATSRQLRGSGAAVAPADTSGSWQPRGKYAPKGNADEDSVLESEKTNVTPPKPAAIGAPTAAKAATSDVNYLYARGWEEITTSGLYANMMVSRPTVAKGDFHSLAELSAQTKDRQTINAVEVGWTVDRSLNNDDDPHLFVYHWVNGKESCYNGCGFVQYSKTVKPGDTLTVGTARRFGIQHTNGGWWVAFDTEWLGYFPDSLWEDQDQKFVQTEAIQTFGEVAAANDPSATCMGNGNNPNNGKEEETASAYISSVTYIDAATTAVLSSQTTGKAGDQNLYGLKFVTSASGVTSTKAFRYGGKGTNSDKSACVTG